MKKAVCLLSGGLDSTVTLYVAIKEDYQPLVLTISYGQRHEKEVEYARVLAAGLKLKHWVVPVSLPWKASALLDRNMALPVGRDISKMAEEIPATYVPARNSVFLSLAASCAEAEGAEAIFIGANSLDYSGYPDCRPEYLEAFSKMIELGTKAGVEGKKIEVKAPLLRMSKKEIILLGKKLSVPFEKTWSCYQGQQTPCGECDSCKLRAKGFFEADFTDPLIKYATSSVH